MWPGPTWADEKSENELKLNKFLHSLLFGLSDKKCSIRGFRPNNGNKRIRPLFHLKLFFLGRSWLLADSYEIRIEKVSLKFV